MGVEEASGQLILPHLHTGLLLRDARSLHSVPPPLLFAHELIASSRCFPACLPSGVSFVPLLFPLNDILRCLLLATVLALSLQQTSAGGGSCHTRACLHVQSVVKATDSHDSQGLVGLDV